MYSFICLAAHTDREETKSSTIKMTVLIIRTYFTGPYLVPIASIMIVSYFVLLIVILPSVGYVLSNIVRGSIMDQIYNLSVTTRDWMRDFVDKLTLKYDKKEIRNLISITAKNIYVTVDQFSNTLADYASDSES